MKITIVYVTARREPHFEWFAESLLRQYPDRKVTDDIIIIDGILEYTDFRRHRIWETINHRFEYRHVPPKPSIWRGLHRKTRRNFYDISGTRNTGLIMCDTDYIVFVDDLSVLTDGWLEFHRQAAVDRIVLSGAYDKVQSIEFDGTSLVYQRCYKDGRAEPAGPGRVASGGGWVFGSNSGFTMDYLLRVNGYDEFLARRGCEDCNLGVRLCNAGYADKLFYNRECAVVENEPLHFDLIQTGGVELEHDYISALRWWRSTLAEQMVVNDTFAAKMTELEHEALYVKKDYLPMDTYFDLEAERALYRSNGQFKPVGDRDFYDFDGTHISKI